MSDKIAEIRDLHKYLDEYPNTEVSSGDLHHYLSFLLAEVDRLHADLATQQGCCDGAASQDAHIRREREEYRAEIERLRSELALMKSGFEVAYRALGDKP